MRKINFLFIVENENFEYKFLKFFHLSRTGCSENDKLRLKCCDYTKIKIKMSSYKPVISTELCFNKYGNHLI